MILFVNCYNLSYKVTAFFDLEFFLSLLFQLNSFLISYEFSSLRVAQFIIFFRGVVRQREREIKKLLRFKNK